MSKFSFFTTAAALIPLFLLPANIYVYIFGPEFGHINRVILCLAIGILAFSVSGMLSHYFSGIGKFHINTQASAIGFIITVAAGFGLIPKYGMAGAGITATLSYLGSTVFQLIVFCISTRTKLKEFFPENEDIKFVRNEMDNYRLYNVVKHMLSFLEELTNWYVRLNRSRMKGEEGIED